MEWKAVIIEKSNIDSNGFIEIIYNIFIDGIETYIGLSLRDKPNMYVDTIKRKMAELKTDYDNAQTIIIPQEIIL